MTSEAISATIDGNEAAARVAYRLNEVIAIYPITPASPMGELADEWATHQQPNIWGDVPSISEMQAEGGAAGAVHGALQAGALSTTFTASQGLLLMIPNMYKIAGELTCCVLHVAARSVATHALSIFCDHSDVMACRQTGFAMLVSSSVQEAQDMACVAQMSTLQSRVPFVHFFDGFRTSHELSKIQLLSDDDLRALIDEGKIAEHRARALTPDAPVVRGTAQNPDVFFQAREACNSFYAACPLAVEQALAAFQARTGRGYQLFEYAGHPEAEHVIVVMGSAFHTVKTCVDALAARGQRVGVLNVRLYRPFSAEHLNRALPTSVQRLAVLDRTKEPGAVGEPLYQDVLAALAETRTELPQVYGGRYGLSSKEFTPAMAQAVFEELQAEKPRRHFTVGITDDVTQLSLDVPNEPRPSDGIYQALFFGLGADGTVGANKNSIKIIGQDPKRYAQAYFVYDSKKSGAVTVSHLRFGSDKIEAPYLIDQADFVGCHQFDFLTRYEVVQRIKPGGVLLLNSPYPADQLWPRLPRALQEQLIEKRVQLHIIDGYKVATQAGLGRRINTIMQTCFFAISGVMDTDAAIAEIKAAVEKTYAKKGQELVRRNLRAIDSTLQNLEQVALPDSPIGDASPAPGISPKAPDFVQRVTATILAGKGDALPVSAFPVDGTWPLGTSQWEKRNIATEIPAWDEKLCIQCNKCVLMCPHAAVRAKVYDDAQLGDAPNGFLSAEYRGKDFKGSRYSIAVAPEDCTGCRLCVEVCPAKDKSNPRHKALEMVPQRPRREAERQRYAHFLNLPEAPRSRVHLDVKGTQLLQPLMEYSGACAGCGETPYIKLLTQMFGDRLLVANATGCSSIYGGNLPTTPYTTNRAGRGPTWSNSLFEDNAEFGFGFRLSVDMKRQQARRLVQELSSELGDELTGRLLQPAVDEQQLADARAAVQALKEKLTSSQSEAAKRLSTLAEYLIEKSVWLVGGDGWAYDIGYGGLDHVLASDKNINVLVLDTEVYSNTGGQQSKATPLGAAAKFAAAGKETPKKDLGLLAMSYGHVYVARVAIGAKDAHTVRAFAEANAHPGPSLIIAYSHCIAHGYDLSHGAQQQKLAVDSGVWPLYHFDPKRTLQGEPPLVLDSREPKVKVRQYMENETRFRLVEKLSKERFQRLLRAAELDAARRIELYEQLSHLALHHSDAPEPAPQDSQRRAKTESSEAAQ